MDRSTCHRLASRSGNGFPAFRLSAVSQCDKRLLGVRAGVSPPPPPTSTPPHPLSLCTVVNILLHTWALMHRDPHGRASGRRSWCSLRHKSHATQQRRRESRIHGYRSVQTHGIYAAFICQECVWPCVHAAISGLLRAAETLFLPIFFGTDTKDPFTPVMHQHEPECISPFPFSVGADSVRKRMEKT